MRDKRDTPGQHRDTFVPLAEAALALGVPANTLRKQLQRGQRAGRKLGALWFMDLSTPGQPSRNRDTVPDRGHTRPGVETDALVTELRAELTGMAADRERVWVALEREQAANAELRILLQRALERQPVLELPAASMPVAEPFSEPEPVRPQRTGWRAWRIWG
jgi:hypothetical protein